MSLAPSMSMPKGMKYIGSMSDINVFSFEPLVLSIED
jgi:hypothetical protein